MFSVKFLALAFAATLLFTSGTSSGCFSRSGNLPPTLNMPQPDGNDSGELRVISEGFHSSIKTPFVALVRDEQTYAALLGLAGDLTVLSPGFFQSHIVVAAYLGQRNTGGYSVAISRDDKGRINVAENAPRKDMMVPQMITAPFKIVSIETNGTPAVSLSMDESFQRGLEVYRINAGTFDTSGGIAGRRETYQLAGNIQVTRMGNLVTIGFAVVGTGAGRERVLRDTATESVQDNAFAIGRLSHGSLVDTPSGDLHVRGKFAEQHRLILNLDTGPVTVPDGYSGRGNIEAERVARATN